MMAIPILQMRKQSLPQDHSELDPILYPESSQRAEVVPVWLEVHYRYGMKSA